MKKYPSSVIEYLIICYKNALRKNINSSGCHTLDLAAPKVRINNRGLLSVRVVISKVEYTISAKSLSYYLHTGKFPSNKRGNQKLVLYPICGYRNCVNPAHLVLLNYTGSKQFDVLPTLIYDSSKSKKLTVTYDKKERKNTTGMQGKRVTKITVETVTHTYSSLEQLQHQKDLDNGFSGAVDVTHTVID